MSNQDRFCQSILEHLKPSQNPYPYEKWKRGRPSKEAKQKRDLWTQWNMKQFINNGGALSFILQKKRIEVVKNEDGIFVKHKLQSTDGN